MITVKGLRSNNANPANPDRHELKEEISAFRLPALVGLMLASLMLYLRSFLPVRAEVLAEEGPAKSPLAETDAARHGPVDMPVEVAENLDAAAEQQAHHAPSSDGDDDYAASVSGLRSRGNASQQDANVLKRHELSDFSTYVRPANTNDPDMPRDSFQNFPSFRPGNIGGGSTGGGSLGNGSNGNGNNGNGNGNNGGDDDDDDDTDITPPVRNRAPRNNGPVYLADVASTATLVIVLSDLLRNSSDPDGDQLSVRNLRSTSGTVTEMADGTWLFTPALTNLGRVIFSFEVWDGLIAVPQHAYSMVTGTPIIDDGDDTGPGGDGDGDDVCEGPGGGVTGYNPVIGDAADNVLIGTDGNDIIRAYAGNDTAYGGHGDDLIYGGTGRDMLSGGTGHDQLYGESDEDVLYGDAGDDLLDGGAASDVLFGGTGDDALFGADGDDVLDGGDG
ncbi:MAG: cadherin-like domain-containing protein, partial [Paracoccaceae bacterium]